MPTPARTFPHALAAAAPVQTGEVDAENAPTVEQAGNTAPGTTLPIALRSGKRLPVLAAVATAAGVPASTLAASTEEAGTAPAQDDLSQGEAAKADDEASPVPVAAAQPLAVGAQLALPEGAVPVPQTSGASAGTSSVATAPKGSPSRRNSLSEKAAPEQPPAGQAPAPSVTVHLATQAKAPADDRPLRVAEGATGSGQASRAAKEDGPAKVDASFGPAPAKLEMQFPAPATVAPNTAVEALRDRAHEGAKAASPASTLHDLTSVVDRLVAAREALAPATAAITVQHGELGDLSLRFDQHRDGHLAVQLSASDPDAHRAIVAAVSDAGFRAAADGQPGSSQQPAPTQANARGHTAERESGSAGNGSAARHDQPQQQRPATQPQERPGGDRRRAGIFA